jgi:hypothetical protein
MTGVRFPVGAIVSSLSPRTNPLFRLTYIEYCRLYSLGIKEPERKVGRLSPCSIEARNAWSFTFSLRIRHTARWCLPSTAVQLGCRVASEVAVQAMALH